MAWSLQVPSHYLNQCWSRYVSLRGLTRPQWVKLPGESPLIWYIQHTSQLGSTVNIWCSRFHYIVSQYLDILMGDSIEEQINIDNNNNKIMQCYKLKKMNCTFSVKFLIFASTWTTLVTNRTWCVKNNNMNMVYTQSYIAILLFLTLSVMEFG